ASAIRGPAGSSKSRATVSTLWTRLQLFDPSSVADVPLKLPFRIDASAADLVAGEDVGAIDRIALGVLDTVHVGHALEGGKVGKDCALPDAVHALCERENGPCRIYPVAVVGDVAVGRRAEYHLDAERVGRPRGKPQAGCGSVREELPRTQPAGVREIKVLLPRLRSCRQFELAKALGGAYVVHFRGDTPKIRAAGAVEPDAPAKPRAELGLIEEDSCGEAGAPVLGGAGCHRRLSPDRREPARGIPASGEARVAEDRSLEAREIPELYGYCRHGGFRPARFFTPARTSSTGASIARDKGQQHLPGDEAWLIGEDRMSGEKEYYLANLPAN